MLNRLNRYFHSRNCTALMFVIAAVMAYMALRSGNVDEITGSRGTVFPSPNRWLPQGGVSLAVSLLLTALTAVSFIGLNKVYNFMRAPSALTSSLYTVMLASLPLASAQFYGGTLMCVVLMGVTALMFGCYGDSSSNRSVFLMFFILSLASLVQYAFMFYIPVAVIGLAQMRIFNLRSIIAVFTGIVCPVWILYGFGVMDFSDIRWPQFTSTLARLSLPGMITVFTAVGLTMILGFTAMCANLMKILSYNAKFRAYNGFLTLLLIFTILFIIVDYTNLSAYFPILCLTSAYQIAHYFSIRRPRGGVWLILSIIVIYLAVYSACYYM
ncbi:MAG: hypothetical protein K2L55_03565 [Muribaculaceae bacterium]|nr:hypothetical protein [Muribaculaceae bacterium]